MTGKITHQKKKHTTKRSRAGTPLHFHCNRKAGGWGAGLPGKQLVSQSCSTPHGCSMEKENLPGMELPWGQ